MAKNLKLVEAQAKIVELEAKVTELEAKVTTLEEMVKKITRFLKAALVFVRKEYVKTLNKEQFATAAGVIVVECLKHIEEKAGTTKCEKCGGHGVVEIRGAWMVCYDCIYGRALGHPGQKHVIDMVVSQMHREEQNRFSKQRPSNWDISEEEKAKAAAASKPTTAEDITL